MVTQDLHSSFTLKQPHVKHLRLDVFFLIECKDLAPIRQFLFFYANNEDLCENVNMDDTLSFLRELKLYKRIININMMNTVQNNYLKKTIPEDLDILLIEN